jgi:hypothetical protein
MKTPSRLMIVLFIALILTAVTYAFAAANTFDPSNAGDGAKAISGYTITNIHYTLNVTNPGNIDSVGFDISPALTSTGTVKIKLVNAGSTWYGCTGTGSITCTTTGATALAADQLSVVAAQ